MASSRSTKCRVKRQASSASPSTPSSKSTVKRSKSEKPRKPVKLGILHEVPEWQLPDLKPEWTQAYAEQRPVTALMNGCYTIENTRTLRHRTFLIKTQLKNSPFAPGERIVSLLTKPDNQDKESFVSFGFVKDNGILLWRKYRGAKGRPTEWEKLANILWHLSGAGTGPGKQQLEAMGLVLHSEKNCIRCNRRLTTPDSIKAGIGPVCAGMNL